MKLKLFLFAIVILFTIFSCKKGKTITKKELIEKKVEEKLSKWSQQQKKSCINKIHKQAAKTVDSILIANAFNSRDSIKRPPKPEKPEKPELKTNEDNQTIEPLFKDSENSIESNAQKKN